MFRGLTDRETNLSASLAIGLKSSTINGTQPFQTRTSACRPLVIGPKLILPPCPPSRMWFSTTSSNAGSRWNTADAIPVSEPFGRSMACPPMTRSFTMNMICRYLQRTTDREDILAIRRPVKSALPTDHFNSSVGSGHPCDSQEYFKVRSSRGVVKAERKSVIAGECPVGDSGKSCSWRHLHFAAKATAR